MAQGEEENYADDEEPVAPTKSVDSKTEAKEEKLVESLKFEPIRDIKQMRTWTLRFKKNIAAVCRDPKEGFKWAAECELKANFTMLEDTGGRPHLDAKLNAALTDSGVISGELARK